MFDSEVQRIDPLMAPIPFKNDKLERMMSSGNIKKTRIGVLEYSSFLGVSKAVKRAMDIAKDALQKIGYEVVPIKLPKGYYDDVRDAYMGMLGKSELRFVLADLKKSNETLLRAISDTAMVYNASKWKRRFLEFAIKYLMNNGRACTSLRNLKRLPPKKFNQALQMRYDLVYRMGEIWNEHGIDALITPIIPHCAIKNKNYMDLSLIIEYSIIWNVTGFPAGVMPITKVRADEQMFTDDYNDLWTKTLNQDAENSEGMPVCVQVVGYNFEDEKVLGVMKMLEKEIKYDLEKNPKIDLNFPGKPVPDPIHGYTKHL